MKLEQVVLRIQVDLRDGSDTVKLDIRGDPSYRGQRHVLQITDDSPPVWRLEICGGS